MASIQLMERHLSDPISLDDLANEAHLGLRQFHRTFKQATGETPANYLRIRRLTEASQDLVRQKQHSILDIALKYEFQSPEVFCRTFTRYFWNTPSTFKHIGSTYHASQRMPFEGEQFEIIKNGDAATPSIGRLPAMHLVGIRQIQPFYGLRVEQNLPEGESISERLMSAIQQLPDLVNEKEWNIAFRKNTLSSHHEIENLFAVEVKKEPSMLPEDLEYYFIREQPYAIFTHSGQDMRVELTVSMAFQWLTQSQFYLGDGPSLFCLDNDQRFSEKLYIPLSTTFETAPNWWKGYSTQYLKRLSGK
ncbi:hypothetical protein GCM10007877_33080 [Marinibactrum halimedae]|uniref:HTH araC/xylS-type domain-containing protein n=2 Tax=Marinibactrum halimedae TaxID=1444977 RepID=A0AA37WMY3_9GAMM|nr:hypothetical protein GCM10007877_33080 [Marinibactrum halimedae]